MGNTGRMMTVWAALCGALALAACESRYEISAEGASPERERTLAVCAKAVLDVPPDEASIDFTFSSTDKRMTRAHEATAAKIAAFAKALAAAAVGPGDLLYGQASYAPDYAYTEGLPPRIASYTAAESLTVRTREFARIPAIIDAAVASGISSMGSLRFYSTKLPEQKRKVRDMAIAAAREKAEQLARGLGAGLGEAIDVSEGAAYAGGGGYGLSPWGYGQFAGVTENAYASVPQAQAAQAQDREPAGPITPGATPLELTVRCTFALD